MEFSFTFLVLAALMGMTAKLILGWDPWKLWGSLALLPVVLMMTELLLATTAQADQQALDGIADSMASWAESALPSIIVGEMAGVCAAAIYDAMRGLLPVPGRRRSRRTRRRR